MRQQVVRRWLLPEVRVTILGGKTLDTGKVTVLYSFKTLKSFGIVC